MRLLSCHIENFGKFSDYSVDFCENPCVMNAPNGWGKSTLAAFVRVMFYGFENEKKRGETLERERVRFRPWQGGVYGGELAFEAGGRKYRMSRTFGKKEAEDTFALYDGVTNLPSGDYTNRIGEEMFRIDQEAFQKTVFIAQNDCGAAATDSINAKIGNLADSLDDLNRYEKVQQTLKDLRNSLTPSRKTGWLKQRREEIARQKDELRRAGAVEQAAAELEERLAESLEEKKELQETQRSLQARWEEAAAWQARRAKREHYSGILRQCEARAKAVEQERAALGGQIPKKDLLAEMQEKRKELVKRQSEEEAHRLSGEQSARLEGLRERFARQAPTREELRRGQELSEALTKLLKEAAEEGLSGEERQELLRLQERFDSASAETDGGVGSELDRALEEWSRYRDNRNALETRRANLHVLQAAARPEGLGEAPGGAGGSAFFAAVLTLALLAAGGALTVMGQTAVGAVFIVIGAVALAAGLVWIGLERRRNRQKREECASRLEQERGRIRLLEQEILEDEAREERLRESLRELLGRFGVGEPDWRGGGRELADELYGLKGDWKRLTRLRARELDYAHKEYEDRQRALWRQAAEILAPYGEGPDPDGEPTEQLGGYFAGLEKALAEFTTLEDRSRACGRAADEARKLGRELGEFLERHGQGAAADADEGLEQIARILNDYENDCRELDRLNSERREFEASCDVDSLTEEEPGESAEELKDCMEQARERLAQLLERIHSYQTQLDEKQQELDALQRQQDRLEILAKEYEDKRIYYDCLGLTAEYLEKAKEGLVARYIGPVQEAFDRYYEMLSGENAEDFRMDANISVTRRVMGQQRQIDAFSSGSRDLIYIVLRIALADAMYEGEKPFLILDDSFVNLDDGKMKLAERFLEGIAGRYQVIYFTCHQSRAMGRQSSGDMSSVN